MNAQQHSIEAAKELINDNPTLFNKFADRELQINIIAAALLQFSIDCDKEYQLLRDEHENDLHPLFKEIINNFNNPLKR